MSIPQQPNERGSESSDHMRRRPVSAALRGWTLRNVFLPVGDAAMAHPMIRRLRFLEQAQWWEPQRIHALRDRLLARVVHVAYAEVPFYRDWLDRAGVRPDEIRRPEDLARIPVVEKKDLRAAYPHRTVRDTGRPTYEACTTGSTGSGFRVMEDNDTAGWYRASFLLAAEWAGWRIGDAHVQSGMALQRTGAKALKDRVMGCAYVAANDLTDEAMDAVLDMMDRRGVRHVWGYPLFGYVLARRALARGWNGPMASFVTWGDALHPEQRRTIEAAFGVRVTDTYGCGEGFQAAAQCGEGATYHTHDLDVVLEYLDEQDRPAEPGIAAQILVTRLHAGPMPLIRYRVGDLGVAGDGAPCPCGRGFGTMTGLQGRISDCVLTPGGNRLPVHVFTSAFRDFADIESFQVVQETADSLRVYVLPAPAFTSETPQRIARALRKYGVADMEIAVESVPEIPPTPGGKRRFVINRLLESPAAIEAKRPEAR
jgi:phenylacetate-CoA ligase